MAVAASSGGISGINQTNSTISDCTSKIVLNTSDGNAGYGGIAGENNGTVYNCQSFGTLTVSSADGILGGVVGINLGLVNKCSTDTTARIKGVKNYGGIVGSNEKTVTSCTNKGYIDASGSICGGIVGKNNGSSASVTLSNNHGNVKPSIDVANTMKSVGGIVGDNTSGTISECCNSGEIVAYTNFAGIAGTNYGDTGLVTKCVNKGSVVGSWGGAGIVADNCATISYWLNKGTITVGYAAGGIAAFMGSSNAKIDYCYNTGFIDSTSTYQRGGILGRNSVNETSVGLGTVTNCLSIGRVNGAGNYGMIIGYFNSGTGVTVNNNFYYSSETNAEVGTNLTSGITSLTQKEALLGETNTLPSQWTYFTPSDTTYAYPYLTALTTSTNLEVAQNGVSEPLELYVTFTYEVGDGIEAFSKRFGLYQDKTMAPDNSYTKTGYIAAGWTNTDGQTFAFSQDVSSLPYAHLDTFSFTIDWMKVSVVTLNTGVETLEPFTLTKGVAYTAVPVVTRQGYVFNGYFSADGLTQYYNADGTPTLSAWPLDGNAITLTAKMTAINYRVWFHRGMVDDGIFVYCVYGNSYSFMTAEEIEIAQTYRVDFANPHGMSSAMEVSLPLYWSQSDGVTQYQGGSTFSNLSSTEGDSIHFFAHLDSSASVMLPNVSAVEGYSFKGWSRSGSVHSAGEYVSISSDTTFVALWNQELPEEPTEDDLINQAVKPNPEGGFVVDGKFSDGSVYDSMEEALTASRENLRKEQGEKVVGTFVNEIINELPGNTTDFEERFFQGLNNLKKVSDGLFTVGDKQFATVEEAVQAVVLQVQTEIFVDKQDELIDIMSNSVRNCDGELAVLAVNHSASEIKDLTLDESANLKDIYLKALDDVEVAQNMQKALNRIADEYNEALASNKYTSDSLEELYAHWEKMNQDLQTAQSNSQISDYLEEWKGYYNQLKLILVSTGDESVQGSVTTEGGLPVDSQIVISQVTDEEGVQTLVLQLIKDGEVYDLQGNKANLSEKIQDTQLVGVYDISLYEQGEKVEYDGKFYVKLLLPEEYRYATSVMVLHILDDNSAEYISAKVVDGYAIIPTESYSLFVIYMKEPVSLIYAIIPATLILAVVVAYFVVGKRNKKVEN